MKDVEHEQLDVLRHACGRCLGEMEDEGVIMIRARRNQVRVLIYLGGAVGGSPLLLILASPSHGGMMARGPIMRNRNGNAFVLHHSCY